MSVGEPTSSATTNLLDLTSVLSSRLVGLNSEKLRTFSSCMDLSPPLSRHYFNKIQKEVLIAAEEEAKASMDRAKTQLETKLGINPITNCVHVAASIDGVYLSTSCLSSAISTATSKVLAYKMASNHCIRCTNFQKKEDDGILSDAESQDWDAHKIQCSAEYSEYANIHLESAVAHDILEQAYNRGIVFPTLVVDGDNDTVESLNALGIYQKRGIDLKIQKIECLSHVIRKMTNTLFTNRVETGTLSIEEGSVESQPNESNT